MIRQVDEERKFGLAPHSCDTDSEPLQVSGLDEPIHLSVYNPRWPAIYAAEARRISSGLPATDIAIEHIGSTAVPGLVAKPIVDVMVGTKRSTA